MRVTITCYGQLQDPEGNILPNSILKTLPKEQADSLRATLKSNFPEIKLPKKSTSKPKTPAPQEEIEL